ncbi:hypothetical protein FISHEDRAFT_58051 [Fistulina hepatica ATCC 64428]|uniref:Uncharacterized protein n=1 Tax=Fistulina hepatica ATCC 64428 TaxID=1128425 RepID=A0A0D7AF93_9AGAR|nr:hypothetical protein FISHEDRAFT_58051 [Fistulina hepatica ATCC 64428]
MQFMTLLVCAVSMLACASAVAIPSGGDSGSRGRLSIRSSSRQPVASGSSSRTNRAAHAAKSLTCTGQQAVPHQQLPANLKEIEEHCPWMFVCMYDERLGHYSIAATPRLQQQIQANGGRHMPGPPLPTAQECAFHCHC